MGYGVYAAAALIFAVVALVFAVALAMRSPARPAWSASDAYDQAAAVVLTTLLSIVIGHAATEFFKAEMTFYAAAFLALTILLASVGLIWQVCRIGPRLRNADAGLSPFRLAVATLVTA